MSENLKNILLVMSTSGYLAPPTKDPKHRELWFETWKRLDRFLPGLFTELFPEDTKSAPQMSDPKTDATQGEPTDPGGMKKSIQVQDK